MSRMQPATKKLPAAGTGFVAPRRGRSLYEPVSRGEPYTLMAEKSELIEVLGQPALFTNDRLLPNEFPEGLYKYELREGDDGSIASVEAYVRVNYGGTVLTRRMYTTTRDVREGHLLDGIESFYD